MAPRRRRENIWTKIYSINGKPSAAVYVMVAGSTVKIGLSVDVGGRVTGIQTGQEKDVFIYWAIRLIEKDARTVERTIHQRMKNTKYHARGEWYYLTPEAAKGVVEKEISKRGFATTTDFRFGYGRG